MQNLNLASLASAAGVMGLYKALQTTISSMTKFARSAIDTYSQFESMQKGLETFFQSGEKGKAVFEDLRKLSNETTFGVDELANSATQLLNVGVGADKINDTLVMIGNTAQGDKTKFAELTEIFAKIQSTGKAGSMQLQQLAMRGLPIYDVLKKIGVTGTATGADITKAFQEMTKEGGQFYNAMENINDTIKGKEGFISDYFRELKVNFAEVTDIADKYKSVLDVVKDKIGVVSEWLFKINENPITKALFNGTLVVALTALTTVIGVTLLGAIKKINKELMITATLEGLLNPTGLIIAGAITGLTAIAVGVKTLGDAYDEVEEKKNKALYVNVPKTYSESQNRISSLDSAKKRNLGLIDDNDKKIAKAKKTIDDYNKLIETRKNSGLSMAELETIQSGYDFDKQNEIIALAEKENKQYRERIKIIDNELLPAQQKLSDKLKTQESDAQKLASVQEKYKEILDKTSFGKVLNEIDTANKKLQELAELKEEKLSSGLTVLTDKEMQNAERMIKEFTEKKRELEIKLVVTNQEDWQKELQKQLEFTDKDVYNGATKSTVGAFDYYEKKFEENNKIQKKFADVTGYNENEARIQSIQKEREALQGLLSSGVYTGNEESLLKIQVRLENLKKAEIDAYFALGNFTKALEIIKQEALKSGDYKTAMGAELKQQFLNSSNDSQNFMNGMMASGGNPMGGLISAVGGALATVASEVDGMDDVLNPLTAIMRTLTPIFEAIVGVLKPFFTTLEGIQSVLHAIVEGILRPFEPLLKLISGIFERLANVFTELFDSLDPIIEVIDMLVDTVLNGIDALLEPILQGFRAVGNFLKIFTELSRPFLAIVNAISKAIKLLAIPLRLLSVLFESLANAIEKFFKPFIDKLEKFGDWVDRLLGDNKDEEEEATENLTQAYKDLLSAMKDMEEYYDERKAKLRGEQSKVNATSVNDMILTPHGNFSTAPDDYIIATKNPSALGQSNGGGNVVMNVKINNSVSDKVTATATQSVDENGFTQLLVNISQKVASDFAKGSNGWDSAVSYRQLQANGRRVSL